MHYEIVKPVLSVGGQIRHICLVLRINHGSYMIYFCIRYFCKFCKLISSIITRIRYINPYKEFRLFWQRQEEQRHLDLRQKKTNEESGAWTCFTFGAKQGPVEIDAFGEHKVYRSLSRCCDLCPNSGRGQQRAEAVPPLCHPPHWDSSVSEVSSRGGRGA